MSALFELWAVAVALLLLALLFLLPPLLREIGQRDDGAATDRARLRGLYAAQLAELDGDLQERSLRPEDGDQAREELQGRLLEDLERHAPQPRRLRDSSAWLRWGPAAGLSLLLPVAALGLYLQVGDPRAAAVLLSAPPATEHASEGAEVDAMVARLAERLARQPDDLQGWMVLARSHEVQQRFEAAAAAYRKAIALAPSTELQAQLQADLADALASAQGGELGGPARAAIDAALALDADQPKALALAGMAAFRRGDSATAQRHWQHLLGRLEPGSELAQRVQSDLASLAGGGAASAAPPAQLAGTVSLAPALRGRLAPNATVFIVARAPEAGRMPVAVLRLRADALPARFKLDDSHAMSPQRPLSGFKSFTLEARLSASGSATRQAGDWLSRPAQASLGSTAVPLVIDAEAVSKE